MIHYPSLREIHTDMIGGYVSKRFKHHVFSYTWQESLARAVTSINPDRANKRIASYVDDAELRRVEGRITAGKDFSLRFGVQKTGTGNFGERGDFCLLGAAYSKKVLTLHYRSLELFGGLVYDQAIILHLISHLKIEVKTIVIMATSCHSFALKGNSNQKLFEKLEVIYGTSNAGSDVNANGPRRRPKRNV
jgi:hypothetical protein